MHQDRALTTLTPGPPVWQAQDVQAWVAEQLRCRPEDLRPMRRIELAPGVRELRYLRPGHSAVVATVARQQPGRYRVRAVWPGGSIESVFRGRVEI